MTIPQAERPLLIYDGECELCQNAIRWIERRETGGRLDVVSFQNCPSPPMTPDLLKQSQRAIQLISPCDEHQSGGRALISVLELLDWRPRITAILARRPFIFLVELVYRIVANNRPLFAHVLFRRNDRSGGG